MKFLKRYQAILLILSYDPILFVSLIAAVFSGFFVPPSMKYLGYVDWRVICLLLSLMLVVGGLQKVGAFGFLIGILLKLVHNTRTLAMALIGTCFFSSMLITNDVALITFVPLGIMALTQINKQELMIPIIVLQTVAANLGSMLTPLGNPQNLYLYTFFDIPVREFLKIMVLPSLLSLVLISATVFLLIKPSVVEPITDLPTVTIKIKDAFPWLVLFLICLLAVLYFIPYIVALVSVIIVIVLLDRKILFRADYCLLFTFVFLFIFIGNITSIPAVSNTLCQLVSGREVTVGVLLSQVISNVPAAILLSKFATNYSALIVGVNLGGLGTLIASMASLISYKIYVGTTGVKKGKYIAVFTVINLLFLGILCGFMASFLK